MKKLEYNLNMLSKYKILIIDELISGDKRFYELMINLNINKKTLNKYLELMTDEKLIITNITHEAAIYSLTDEGKKLIPLINVLKEI